MKLTKKPYRSYADIVHVVNSLLMEFGRLRISIFVRKANLTHDFVHRLMKDNIIEIKEENTKEKWVTLQ